MSSEIWVISQNFLLSINGFDYIYSKGLLQFCKTSYLQSEQKQNQSAFNQHSFIHSVCNLEFMIFSCSMRAVSLYFKNLRYI